jgi:hypothetical protein
MRHSCRAARGLLTATALFAMYLTAVSAVAATVNFAQTDQTITPAPTNARRLATYFSPPYSTGPMPSAVNEILARNAPPELHAGCAATVASWSPAARGSSRVSIRILAVAAGSAWLAYRCDSRLPQLDGTYSELLAVFNSARRSIQFVSLLRPEDNAATLYHVGLDQIVKLRGAEDSAAFLVFAVASKPSGHGTSRGAAVPPSQSLDAENRFVVIANSATMAKPVLTLVTARERPGMRNGVAAGGGTPESDEYRAALRNDHDLTGHLTAVNEYYRKAPTGARSHFGVARYVWNPASFSFALAAPILPASRPRPIRLPAVPGYNPLAY